jgi:hypothetical protein
MPDTRIYDPGYTDINGDRHRVRCQNFSNSKAGFRRWCFFCAALAPASFSAKPHTVRCQSCTKRLRGFEEFILAQNTVTMATEFCAQRPPVPATSTAMGEALRRTLQ